MAEAIVYQSVRDANGNAVQQMSNLCLTGLTTITGQTQHTHGRLYAQYVQVTGTKTFTSSLENYAFSFSGGTGLVLAIYSDPTRFNLVGVASSATVGQAQITPANNSGLGGTVNFMSYTADDVLIEIVALLSVDDDLPMDYISGLPEWDATVGFAPYHLAAFEYICEFLKGRERSSLWNPAYIDSKSINGGVGGYDLSRIINIQNQSMVEASAQYAFFKLAERQYLEPGSVWDVRAKTARGLVRAHLEDSNLSFDLNNQRQESKSRALSSWRISRS